MAVQIKAFELNFLIMNFGIVANGACLGIWVVVTALLTAICDISV